MRIKLSTYFDYQLTRYQDQIRPHEVYPVLSMSAIQAGKWLQNRSRIAYEQQIEAMEQDTSKTENEFQSVGQILSKGVTEADLIAKSMFRAWKKGGLDAVHEHVSEIASGIEALNLIEHTWKRYLDLRRYINEKQN